MPMPAAVAVNLPGTTWWSGRPLRRAWVRPVTGHDEWLAAEQANDASAAEWVSRLLGRCVLALGDGSAAADEQGFGVGGGVGADVTGDLTVGDREALLLQLRRLTYGDALTLVADCGACHEPMDLDLSIGQLLAVSVPESSAEHELDGFAFRLPTGRDQEAVAYAALDDPEAAAAALMARCLLSGQPDDETIGAIAARMEELDPLAEIALQLSCPACQVTSAVVLDTGNLVRTELIAGQAALDASVHLLALHYHWTEQDIFDLPVSRRRRYVELLADALSEPIG